MDVIDNRLSSGDIIYYREGRMLDLRKYCCLVFVLLGLCWISPTFAETQQPLATKQESDKEKASQSPKPGDKELSQKPIPFAQYENALKNSEKWETLSPEEQKEALDKIEQYRKLFRQRQAELQKKYKPLLERENQQSGQAYCVVIETNLKRISSMFGGKWLALTPFRQKELIKKWKIPKALPSKSREALLKLWKKLMPTTRQQFLRDLG